MPDATYALELSIGATGAGGYLQIIPDPDVAITQANFQFMTTATGPLMVSVYTQVIQLQLLPSEATSGSVTITTSAATVSGSMIVNPALTVPATLVLHDARGQQIGAPATLEAGQISVNYSWAVM